jgi:hypothetical protein
MPDVTIVYSPTASARAVFDQAGGESLPATLPFVPAAGDEFAVGGTVFTVLRRRIVPGPPLCVTLTLDHPARPARLR